MSFLLRAGLSRQGCRTSFLFPAGCLFTLAGVLTAIADYIEHDCGTADKACAVGGQSLLQTSRNTVKEMAVLIDDDSFDEELSEAGEGQILLQANKQTTKRIGALVEDTSDEIVDSSHIEVNEEVDVVYAGDDQERATLQWPAAVTPEDGWPAVIVLHGAGVSKESVQGTCKQLATIGRLCMAVDYPLGDVKRVSSHLMRAMDWLTSEASGYTVNPKRIALFGHSTGGILASKVVWQNPQVAERLSAVLVVNGGSDESIDMARHSGPRFYIASCKNDPHLPYTSSEKLHAKLNSLGAAAKLFTCDREGHFASNADGFYKSVASFLRGA